MMPVIDWGGRKAEVERKKSEFNEAYHQYRKTVLTAFKETEDSIYKNNKLDEKMAALIKSLETERLNEEYIHRQYKLGLMDYVSVLNASYAEIEKERQLFRVQQQVKSERVTLASAVFGKWLTDEMKKQVDQYGKSKGLSQFIFDDGFEKSAGKR